MQFFTVMAMLAVAIEASGQDVKQYFGKNLVLMNEMNPWKSSAVTLSDSVLMEKVANDSVDFFWTKTTNKGTVVEYSHEWLDTITSWYNHFSALKAGTGIVTREQMIVMITGLSHDEESETEAGELIIGGRDPFTGKARVALSQKSKSVFRVYDAPSGITVRLFKKSGGKGGRCWNPVAELRHRATTPKTGGDPYVNQNAIVQNQQPAGNNNSTTTTQTGAATTTTSSTATTTTKKSCDNPCVKLWTGVVEITPDTTQHNYTRRGRSYGQGGVTVVRDVVIVEPQPRIIVGIDIGVGIGIGVDIIGGGGCYGRPRIVPRVCKR